MDAEQIRRLRPELTRYWNAMREHAGPNSTGIINETSDVKKGVKSRPKYFHSKQHVKSFAGAAAEND